MISILCPTRGRPFNMERLVGTIDRTAEDRERIEVIFYVDEDDEESLKTVNDLDCECVTGPRITLSQCWNECAAVAEGDILMRCGDDVAFRTRHWDRIVRSEFDRVRDKILYVHGKDGIQNRRMGTHGFVHRRWIETIGMLVPPYFASDYDNLWLTEVADALRRRRYREDLFIEHMHPIVNKAIMDETYEEKMQRHRDEDCDGTWERTKSERQDWVRKLRKAMR